MNELEKAAKYLQRTNRGYFVALHQYNDGKGVQYQMHGDSDSLLGIFAALADAILTGYMPKYGRDAVVKSLTETLKNTIDLHKEE